MSDNTTHVEGLDFTVQDHATAPAEHMAKAFERVHHAAEATTRKLGEMTHHAAMSGLAMVGLGFGFREVAKFAGDANLELEHAAKKIAGVQFAFSNWKAGTTGQEKWNESMVDASRILAKLEPAESRLKMTRADLAEIYKSQAMMSERYRQSEAQQLDLTEKLGATQKVLGINAEAAGDMIGRAAMTGAIPLRSQLGRYLAASVGDLKKFRHESEALRFEKLKKALGDMLPAAAGMGKGIEGSMFDAKKALNDLTRDLTGPVFQQVTKDVAEWAHKLAEVRENGQSAAAEWGGKLVTAFGYLKDATAFIADHWKTIAGIWVATKLTGGLQGLSTKFGAAGAAAGGASATGTMNVSAGVVNVSGGAAAALGGTTAAAIGDKLKPGLASTVGKLAGFAAKAGMVTEALGGLYLGLQAAATELDEWHTKSINRDAQFGEGSAIRGGLGANAAEAIQAFREAADKDLQAGSESLATAKAAKAAYTKLRGVYGAGVIGEGGKVNIEAAKDAYGAMDLETRKKQLSGLGLDIDKAWYNTDQVQTAFADRLAQVLATLLGAGANAPGATADSKKKLTAAPVTQINVAHMEITQEFKQADPDRVFHNVPRDIADMLRNPRGSNIPPVPG